MTTIPAATRRALWVLTALCGLLTIAAVLLVSVRPGPATLPAGQPAAAAQAYINAFLDEDWDTVRHLSVQDGEQRCPSYDTDARMGIDVLEVTEHSDSAQLRVRITNSNLNGPFSLAENSYEDTFEMKRQDGQWKISRAPWNLALCTDKEMGF
ncbi:hypothetical protein [Specibacter sp. RAF43]|uniref:hypothetical protein n=1 Tax=Specibacter sp. RAF43 TaxID=3233057 RepID=UPI003F95C53E